MSNLSQQAMANVSTDVFELNYTSTSPLPVLNLTTETTNYSNIGEIKCTLFHQNQHYCDVIIGVKRTTASLSLVGCLFVIAVIWLFRKYAIFSQRLILYLSIAAIFDSIFHIMGDLHPPGPLCSFQAWGLTCSDWSVLLWVCCITFNLFRNAVQMERTEHLEYLYHFLSWGVALIISCLPFIGNHYGPAGAWCWIVDNWKWRFGIWYCPLFLIIAALFFAYTYIIVTVNKKLKTWEGLYDPDVEHKKKLLRDDVKPLKGYPFVYLACSLFPLINRIQMAASANPVFGLVMLHALTSPLQGALNAVVFCLDKETRSRLNLTQIRLALRDRRYRSKSLIREYPTDSHIDCNVISDYQATNIQNLQSQHSSILT